MAGTKRRILRLVGALGLTGAILAGPMGVGNAQAAQLDSFASSSTGYALRVTLDLRNGPLMDIVGPVIGPVIEAATGEPFTGVIDQYFIKTTSEADGNGLTKATSVLAEGLVDLDSIEASSVGQLVERTFQTIDGLPLIGGELGSLKAGVNEGPAVLGNGVLNELNVGLGSDLLGEDLDLGGLLDLEELGLGTITSDLTEQLNALLGGLLGEEVLGDLLDDLTGTVDGLVGELTGGALDGLLGGLGVSGAATEDDVLAAVTGLVDEIVGTVTGLLESALLGGDLLASIEGLANETGVVNLAGDKVASQSSATVENMNLLGGIVDIGLFNLFSRSEAAGTPGSATNASDCSIADVNLGGGALSLALDGSNLAINGEEVPLVGDLVGQVKGVVDELLNTLGLDIGLCETAKVEADPAGKSAAQSVSALRVEVAPLGLFSLVIDPTVQTAVAAQPQAASTPDDPDDPTPSLPKTGAAHVATALSGLALAGAAVLVRRKLI